MRTGRWVAAGLLGVVAVAAGMTPASASEPVVLLPLGASITHGYGSTDGNGYRGVLYERLTREAGLSVDFVGSQRSGTAPDPDHEGHPGWRIDQIAARADGWLATYHPDIVVMHLGTNDMIQDYRSATAPDRVVALADHIVAADPGVTVYVSSLVCSSVPAVNARIDAFNARLPALVAGHYGVVYVDQHAVMTAADLSDQVHPTDHGYHKIADAWYDAIVARR
ncbi:SGNH/GDSL hydrolase family protein [Winogradskya consettensis]|uniref:SGNH/GDSL hydrolase family protein n=1 Tax=Winogradskya consettensis TaxID=113560 RepID=UPI001BB414E2|nr:SGNH/GDSL hydrolase family protein [Actinoplanes consettensis]